jgi:pentose-5-phosphate-3-epimerase
VSASVTSSELPAEPLVAASLYAAARLRLGDQVDALLAAGARVFHVDVGDGHFIEPIALGEAVVSATT